MKQLFEFVESFRCRQGGWKLTADQVLIEQAVKPKLRKRGGETGILGTGENDSFHRLGLTIGGGADGGAGRGSSGGAATTEHASLRPALCRWSGSTSFTTLCLGADAAIGKLWRRAGPTFYDTTINA